MCDQRSVERMAELGGIDPDAPLHGIMSVF